MLEKPLGAEELLPQLLIALQTHFQENEKDNLLKIKNYIIPSHMDQYIGAETSYMIFSFTLAAACFSAEHAALNTHPISAKTNASIEAEISAPSFIKKVAESFAFIYEESLPDNAFIINSKFKLAAYFTAGAVIGLAVAAAVFFTGGLALPVLALAGVGLGAAAIGGFSLTGLTKGITSIVNTVQSRLLRWKLRLDITASLNEETSAPPIAVSVANEKIAATAQTSIAALHESAVPTLQVAVLSGVIEKLAENSPGIAEPTNASGTVYGENESDANLSVLSDDSMDGLEGTDSYSYSDSDLDLDSDLQIKSKNNYRIGALPFGSQFWKGDLKNEGQASMSEQRASIG